MQLGGLTRTCLPLTLLVVAACARAPTPEVAVGPPPPPVPTPLGALPAGVAVSDFTLKDLDGQEVRLADYLARGPVLLDFGSYTCTACTAHLEAIDRMADKYRGQIEFLLVYGVEGHPEDPQGPSGVRPNRVPIPQATTYEQRRQTALWLRDEKQVRRRILVDELGEGSVQRRWGAGPVATAILVLPDGAVALRLPLTLSSYVLDRYLELFLANGGKPDPSLLRQAMASRPASVNPSSPAR